MDCSTKLHDTQSLRPKQNKEPSFHATQPIRRHPTCLKVAKAASSVQLEETQLKNNEPFTIHLDSNVIRPQNQLSHQNLLKTKDKDVWVS